MLRCGMPEIQRGLLELEKPKVSPVPFRVSEAPSAPLLGFLVTA
jgi:hypothetical protein